MAPSTSTTASPLSRILLSLPKPNTAQPSRCAKAPTTDSAAAAGAKKKNLVLSRREAAATALSTVLSRVLPAVAAETDVASAATGECALETTPSGLAYCDRVVGAGAEAVKGQLIKAHYRGMLEDGTVFDSSYGRGRPLTIMVGVGEVIKGWDLCIAGGEGIPPMRVGGKRSLKLPPELAYGEKGAGCRGWEPTSCVIPPNSTLLFDVEYVGRASS
ncbi:peptidyl-prolyl cis-trans isomerase FKBP13, chloroplastic [Lolium perenne]|uniref:peptidyl-prolyl cis-trans isomerase FKBP13, chloroplastic n=1 Tax=Lolium perenne TaxID=4522 RepID=UPI0021EB2315|nr:peptidyl-prolyl cis-trans isomerase FKBP13, chloroplastic-like [Lolium perenne]